MSNVYLGSTDCSKVRILSFKGQPVFDCAKIVKAIVAKNLGQDFSEFFSSPEKSAGKNRVDWYSSLEGEAISLSKLPEDQKQKFEALFKEKFDSLLNLSNQLINSSETSKRSHGELLELALSVDPFGENFFIVNEKPVLIGWGFAKTDGSVVNPEDILRRGVHNPKPVPVVQGFKGHSSENSVNEGRKEESVLDAFSEGKTEVKQAPPINEKEQSVASEQYVETERSETNTTRRYHLFGWWLDLWQLLLLLLMILLFILLLYWLFNLFWPRTGVTIPTRTEVSTPVTSTSTAPAQKVVDTPKETADRVPQQSPAEMPKDTTPIKPIEPEKRVAEGAKFFGLTRIDFDSGLVNEQQMKLKLTILFDETNKNVTAELRDGRQVCKSPVAIEQINETKIDLLISGIACPDKDTYEPFGVQCTRSSGGYDCLGINKNTSWKIIPLVTH